MRFAARFVRPEGLAGDKHDARQYFNSFLNQCGKVAGAQWNWCGWCGFQDGLDFINFLPSQIQNFHIHFNRHTVDVRNAKKIQKVILIFYHQSCFHIVSVSIFWIHSLFYDFTMNIWDGSWDLLIQKPKDICREAYPGFLTPTLNMEPLPIFPKIFKFSPQPPVLGAQPLVLGFSQSFPDDTVLEAESISCQCGVTGCEYDWMESLSKMGIKHMQRDPDMLSISNLSHRMW